MISPTPQQLAQSGTLEDLYAQLSPIKVVPGWAKTAPSLWPEPKKSFQAHCWSYEHAKGGLDAAGRLINTELAERRNLILQNPATGYATSRTIVAASAVSAATRPPRATVSRSASMAAADW